jgi:hypothetical protein
MNDDDNAHMSHFSHVTACSYSGNCYFMKRFQTCKNSGIPCSREDRDHMSQYSHQRQANENNENFLTRTPQKAFREETCPPAPTKRQASTMKVRSHDHVEYKLSESDSQICPPRQRPPTPSAPRNTNSSKPTKCLCFFGLDCIYYINFHNKVMMKNPAIAGPTTDHISKFSH